MPDGPNALCAAPEGICGVQMYPVDCLGRVVDLVTGNPVVWSDPTPAGGLSGVGTLKHIETMLLDPISVDDTVVAEGRPGEYTEPGYVKYFEGQWTLDRTVNTAAEAVMGLMDVQVDAVSELVKSTTPVTGAARCSVCGPDNCPTRWVQVTYQPMFDIVNTTRTPTLRGGLPLYRVQVHPGLRAVGGVSVAKSVNAADQPDRTVTVRSEGNPAFWAQIKANPPAWFPHVGDRCAHRRHDQSADVDAVRLPALRRLLLHRRTADVHDGRQLPGVWLAEPARMSTPEVVAVRLVEAGGLELSFAEGLPRVIRLNHGDLSQLELWAESEADMQAEIEERTAALEATGRDLARQIGEDGSPEQGSVDALTEQAAQLRADVKRLAADNRRAALEVWRHIPAIVEMWPDHNDTPAILSVRLLGEWRAAIEGDPFVRSPGQPIMAQVTVNSQPASAKV
jgi:hypothetical protein